MSEETWRALRARGGARPGAGRPREGEGETITRSVRLYPADVARLQRLAVALRISESAVVRAAIELLARREDG